MPPVTNTPNNPANAFQGADAMQAFIRTPGTQNPGNTNPQFGNAPIPYSYASNPAPQGTTPTSPAVITSKSAQQNFDAQQTGYQNIQQGVQMQQANKAINPPPSNGSIVDFLKGAGQDSSLQARANLAVEHGLVKSPDEYMQLATQGKNGDINTQLLGALTSAQKNPQEGGVTAKDMADIIGGATGTSGSSSGGTTDTSSQTQNTGITQTNGTTDETNPQAAAITAKLAEYNDATDQAFNGIHNSLAELANGTFPLTAPEQALMSSLQNSINQQVAAQKLANANYVGGITNAGIAAGRNQYAPEIELGNIANAVNVGLQKIADIESKGVQSMATLQMSFDDKNYQRVNEEYSTLTSYLKDKTAALQKMHDDVLAAAKDQRDNAQKMAQQAIDNQMNSEKFDYQKTQDAISNAFKQQQITETQRHNMETEALARAAQGGGIGGAVTGLPTVSMTASGIPDPQAQATFLASLPQDVQTLVKGVADYTLNPNLAPQKNYKGASGLTQAQMLSLVKQYDPTYDEKAYATRQAYQKSLASNTSGTVGGAVNSANKSVNHLSSFVNSMSQIPNGVIAPINALDNTVTLNQGVKQNIATAQTEGLGVADELAKFFKGSGTSDVSSINAWKNELSTNASPASVHGLTQGAINLLSGQLETLSEQYKNTMGKASPNSFIGASAMKNLQNLKNQGYTVDIPGVNYTDKDAYLKYGGGTTDNLTNAFNLLQSAGLPTTPENILQAAQLQ